jgi:CheY-like chemotaxis protein
VPLVALDEVMGLLFVRTSAGDYTDHHRRALSVVAAKLADHFALLRARAELVDLTRERDEARRGAEAADGRLLADIRVLLVDHDLGLRESLQSVLDHYGAQVTAVESAPEALAVLEQARPDVLLFGDLAIRGESSYDVMREVTARTYPLPIASISAWRLEEKEREAAAGLRLHLAKPLEIGALLDAIVELAGRGQTKPAH